MAKLDWRQNGQPITIRLSDAVARSNNRTHFFEVQLKPHDVVVLHPSLGCPLIAKPGDDLRIFLLADADFQQLFDTDVDTVPLPTSDPPLPNPGGLYYKQGGPQVKAVINRVLKILKWDAGKKIEDVPLYPDTATALANIEVYSLGDTNGFKDGRLKDKDGALFALLRDSSRKAYQDLHAKYLFQVDLKVGAMSKSPKADGLYDIAWLLPDPQNPTLASYAEIQDRSTQAFARDHLKVRTQAYKIDVPFNFSTDLNTPIQNRHPIFITSKDKLNLGHLTDVHISSRQMAMRQSQAQVLQTPAEETPGSEILGKQINVTFDTLKNLLDQIGKSAADVLVLTGDLVDFNRNLDPSTVKDWSEKLKTPGELWEVLHSTYHTKDQHYAQYLDDLIIYSLLIYFCTTYQKPVFITGGNHEMYSLPYGLSPRVLWIRANQGVPADHNLTISEALLLYGPDYGHAIKLDRHTPKNLDWLHTVFTPFTDYALAYQGQRFIALAWGDDESIFMNSKFRGGGDLPRANQSLSDAQYELLQQGVTDGSQRVLLSHFTLASYAADQALGVEGQINCNNTLQKPGDYDQGSFIEKRHELYGHVQRHELHYTLSGHSHRAGLYEPLRFEDAWGRTHLTVKGHEIPLVKSALPFQGAAAIITTGSGGPIGCQNHYAKEVGGLGDCGLDWPSGTILTLDGDPTIQRIIPKTVKGAQPRFAVALDYFDLLKERVFISFESATNDGPFEVRINRKLPQAKFIKDMALFAYVGSSWKEFQTITTDKGPGALTVIAPTHEDEFQKKVMKEENPVVFLVVKFNTNLDKITGYTQYNFGSPWLMRVEVKRRTELQGYGEAMVAVPVGGYTIRRHSDYGEIPEFDWYAQEFPNLYWIKKRAKLFGLISS